MAARGEMVNFTPSPWGGRIRLPRLFFTVTLGLCLAAAVTAGWNIFAIQTGYSVSRAEYEALQAKYAPIAEGAPAETAADLALTNVNPDYIGWLCIKDSSMDYPVVQGQDNEKYLSVTFMGENGRAGAIFMDYRCEGGFDSPYAVVYGHNAGDGTMFAELNRYAEPAWREEHPDITVTVPSGAELSYRVFSVQDTDVGDAAYQLDFADRPAVEEHFARLGAQRGTKILTLSTCADSGGKNARLLVHAARVD
ncbi:MAG: class B sortase [Syntrophomonadaceae bacterium]|jgi:sortase B|nr:class B sortase [Syntrophomonadaceae bacterium]